MASVPTIPDIQAPQTQSATAGVGDTINSLLEPIAKGMNTPLPDPYVVGKEQQQPHVQQKQGWDQLPSHNTPITSQVADVKRARRQNAVAGLANMIGEFGNKINAKKTAVLQDKITDVMKGKQNIENAQKVLATPGISDAQKKMAQGVIDANKKNIDGILSEPKNQKQLAKAFDISFVDPEKNKTPEVQAMQGALKQFQQAGPFTADNPQEHAIAQLASGGGGSMHPAYTNVAPVTQQQPQTQGAQPPKLQAAQSQSAGPQQEQTKSATPYADAALAKDMPTLEINPQYTQAYEQKQQMQNTYLQMLPKIVDAGVKAQIQAAKDGNAQALAVFKENAKYRDQIMHFYQQENLQSQAQKNAMTRIGAENANRVLLARMRIDAQLKVADSPYLTPEQRAAVKANAKDDIEKNVNSTSSNISRIDADISKINSFADKTPEQQDNLKLLQIQRNMELQALTKFQELRAEKLGIPPTKAPVVTTPTTQPEQENWMEKLMNKAYGKNKDGDANARPESTTESEPAVEHVGADDSDESDDSDTYGTN